MLPRTKIVATIGPACWDEPVLGALLAAGVSVVRFNFSHAEQDTTGEKIALVRRLAEEQGRNVATLADLQGPRIRVGDLPPQGVALVPGSSMTLSTRSGADCSPGTIPVDYEGLARDVEPGDTILLDEGLLSLQVIEVHPAEGRIECTVLVGGQLTSNKGINVPARALSVPAVTEKDRADLAFAIDQGMDMVALSFVRTAGDITEARRLIGARTERDVPIIAKIEKGAAVDNFEAILAEADGIMVARGDMGVELPPEVLPGIQKRLIAAANLVGKPVITATQMLDSMIRNPRPTRAEATDVANAVLDGTDAVMLSGETAMGKYPVEAAQTMARIAHEAERLFDYDGWAERMAGLSRGRGYERQRGAIKGRGSTGEADPRPLNPALYAPESPRMREVTEALCEAADRIGDELGAKAIIALTRSGTSARLVAKYRPRPALIAVTDRLPTQRALAVTWGVQALLMERFGDTLDALDEAERLVLSAGLISPGDLLVFASGLPQPLPGQTTLLKVHVAGA